MINRVHCILYVDDQKASTAFYAALLEKAPSMDVPGMTEFELPGGTVLGLMPRQGIQTLLEPDSKLEVFTASSLPAWTSELYLVVEDAQAYLDRALCAGGRLLSSIAERDWGHRVGYCLDLDRTVLAFAEAEDR